MLGNKRNVYDAKWRVSRRREIKWREQDYLPNMATSASIAQSSNDGRQTFGVFLRQISQYRLLI